MHYISCSRALSRAFCVKSRITKSEDTSGEDGEGEESVQGVTAQQRLLVALDGASIFINDHLCNQRKKKVQFWCSDKSDFWDGKLMQTFIYLRVLHTSAHVIEHFAQFWLHFVGHRTDFKSRNPLHFRSVACEDLEHLRNATLRKERGKEKLGCGLWRFKGHLSLRRVKSTKSSCPRFNSYQRH